MIQPSKPLVTRLSVLNKRKRLNPIWLLETPLRNLHLENVNNLKGDALIAEVLIETKVNAKDVCPSEENVSDAQRGITWFPHARIRIRSSAICAEEPVILPPPVVVVRQLILLIKFRKHRRILPLRLLQIRRISWPYLMRDQISATPHLKFGPIHLLLLSCLILLILALESTILHQIFQLPKCRCD